MNGGICRWNSHALFTLTSWHPLIEPITAATDPFSKDQKRSRQIPPTNPGHTLGQYRVQMQDIYVNYDASCAQHTCICTITMQCASLLVIRRIFWSSVHIIWFLVIVCTLHHVLHLRCIGRWNILFASFESHVNLSRICQIHWVLFVRIRLIERQDVGLYANRINKKYRIVRQELPRASYGNHQRNRIGCWSSWYMASIKVKNDI